MNLNEALLSAREGNFITNEYFDRTQSLHYYNGKFYYEDGAVVSRDFLRGQDFAVNGKWSISINKDDIDYDKLKEMHDKYKGYMLINDSYMNCKSHGNKKFILTTFKEKIICVKKKYLK